MLNVVNEPFMLSNVMLGVIMLNVAMLSDVAPFQTSLTFTPNRTGLQVIPQVLD
jgi:hypothetical protein